MTERGVATSGRRRPVRGRGPASARAPRAGRDPRRGARVRLGLDRGPPGLPQSDPRLAGGAQLRGGADAPRADRPVRVPARAPASLRRRQAGRLPGRAVEWPCRLRCRRGRRVPEGVRGGRRPAPRARRARGRGHRGLPGALGAVSRVVRGPLHALHGRRARAEAGPARRPADLGRRPVGRGPPPGGAPRGRLGLVPRDPRAVPRGHAEDRGVRGRSRPAARSGPLRARPRALHGRRRRRGASPFDGGELPGAPVQPALRRSGAEVLPARPARGVRRSPRGVRGRGRRDVRHLLHRAAGPRCWSSSIASGPTSCPACRAGSDRAGRRPSHGGPDRGRAGRPRPRPRGRGRDLHALRRPRPARSTTPASVTASG